MKLKVSCSKYLFIIFYVIIYFNIFPALSILEVFPTKKGFIWYYEGALDFEKTTIIEKVKISSENITLNLKSINDDLTGEIHLEERIYKETILINPKEILINNEIALKEPLKIENSWKVKRKINNVLFQGENKIIEINKNTIKTRLTIQIDKNKFYLEENVYEVGKGLISKTYNVPDIENYFLGYSLTSFSRENNLGEKWYNYNLNKK